MRPLWVLLLIQLLPQAARAQDAPPALVAAVQRFVNTGGERELPDFRHALVDLDGDGRRDAIVLLQSQAWCGSGGCTMLVLRGVTEGFALVSRSTITNEPIRVSPERSHGWRTLIVSAKGAGDVVMRFDGKRYPLNPSVQPKATPTQVAAARVVIDREPAK